MYQAFVQLEKVEDVKRFVALCSQVPFDVELKDGHYVTDAKSIMGIFSLNLSHTVTLEADCDGEEAAGFARMIQAYTVLS